MTADEISETIKRIDGIWPPRTAPTVDERQEWVKFLQPLEGWAVLAAIDDMRDSVMFRPTMAEMRTFYTQALAVPCENALQLQAGECDVPAPSLLDLYGSHQADWIYCWKCDMAISLEELSGMPRFDERRGLFHKKCPKSGAAPAMPVHLRIARQEYWTKHKITATP